MGGWARESGWEGKGRGRGRGARPGWGKRERGTGEGEGRGKDRGDGGDGDGVDTQTTLESLRGGGPGTEQKGERASVSLRHPAMELMDALVCARCMKVKC